MIDAERVRKAINKHFRYLYCSFTGASRNTRAANTRAAKVFGVSERTMRRWCTTGLPLCYGHEANPSYVTLARWEEFEQTGALSTYVSNSPGSSQNGQVINPEISQPVRVEIPSTTVKPVPRRRRTRVDRHVSETPATRTTNKTAKGKHTPKRAK